eukprot:921556-Prymnesium_polylepis.1
MASVMANFDESVLPIALCGGIFVQLGFASLDLVPHLVHCIKVQCAERVVAGSLSSRLRVSTAPSSSLSGQTRCGCIPQHELLQEDSTLRMVITREVA